MYIPTQSKKANHGIEGKGFTAYDFYMRACLCWFITGRLLHSIWEGWKEKGRERKEIKTNNRARVYHFTNIIVPYAFLFHTYTVVAYIA